MTLDTFLDALPEYAQDLKLNLKASLEQSELTPQQLWGTAVASAMAARHPGLLKALEETGAEHLNPAARRAARTAAALMGMNNVFYRFQHLSNNPTYARLRSGLRMNGRRTHGVELIDFELWCTAVSAINGCGVCVVAHEKVLLGRGVTEQQILASIRVASVVSAIATVLDAENL